MKGIFDPYSHLSNKRGSWNKRGGGAKNAKSPNIEGGINIQGMSEGFEWYQISPK